MNYAGSGIWDIKDGAIGPGLKTSEVSRIDLIIRWGGRQRLSGFLHMQSVYSVSMWWMTTGPALGGNMWKMPLSGMRPRILPWEDDFDKQISTGK